MQSYNNIAELRAKIDEILLPLIGTRKECVYLDLPFHSNLGDLLIWQGTRDFLKVHHIKCTYCNSIYTNHKMRIKKGQLILMHGGGNFGDVWREHQLYRRDVIEKYPDHRIIILPQSVQYADETMMEEDSKVFAQHHDLHICARDAWSYEYLTKHFKNKAYLVPDMAFHIELDKYRYKTENVSAPDPNVLYVKRGDHETPCALPKEILENKKYDTHDWPTIGVEPTELFRSIAKKNALRKAMMLYKQHPKEPMEEYIVNWYLFNWLLGWNERTHHALDNFINRWMERCFLSPIFAIGKEFVEKYDEVVADRLHVGILCTLLGVKIQLIDNNYGKNSRFYNTWLKGFDNITLVQNSQQ